MRVTALVSLVLALSVSSLPVTNPLGSAGTSQLGGVKSTLDKAAPPAGLRLRTLPGDKVDPNQVKQVAGQVENKVTSATNGTPNPANVKAPGAVGQGLNGASAKPVSRRAGVTGVTDKLKGAAGSTEDKAKGAASGPQGKVADTAPKAPGGVAQRAAVPPPPGLGGAGGNAGAVAAEVQQEITNAASKIGGTTTGKGAPGIPGSAPAS